MKKRRRFTEASLSRLTTSAPVVVVSPTLQKLLAGDNVRSVDWALFVKAIQIFQEAKRPFPDFLGGIYLPPEFAEKLSAELARRSADWNLKHGTKRARDARARRAEWQELADKVWQRNPSLSRSTVAKMIAPHVRAVNGKRPSWHTIRLWITKPKKI
jgi:hypothetical protein